MNGLFLEPPDSPGQLKVTDYTSRKVQLSWTQQYEGNSPVLKYLIEYKQASGKFLFDCHDFVTICCYCIKNTFYYCTVSSFTYTIKCNKLGTFTARILISLLLELLYFPTELF